MQGYENEANQQSVRENAGDVTHCACQRTANRLQNGQACHSNERNNQAILDDSASLFVAQNSHQVSHINFLTLKRPRSRTIKKSILLLFRDREP
jgi:hypothetical protein